MVYYIKWFTCRLEGHEACEGGEAVLGHRLLRGDNESARTITDSRGVGGGDGAVLLEQRLELLHTLDRGVRAANWGADDRSRVGLSIGKQVHTYVSSLVH